LGNYATSVIGAGSRELDITVLGAFVTPERVGVYRVAKNFLGAVWAATDPVFFALYPELARLWAGGQYKNLRILVRRLTAALGAVSVLLVGLLAIVVPRLAVIVFGPGFREAGPVFRVMIWCAAVWIPLMWAPALASVSGRTYISAIALSLATGVAVTSYAALAPRYGETGVAIGYSLGVALNPLIVVLWSWRVGLFADPPRRSERSRGATSPG
jgi:O-antigen/teichoic acid export membrane protein